LPPPNTRRHNGQPIAAIAGQPASPRHYYAAIITPPKPLRRSQIFIVERQKIEYATASHYDRHYGHCEYGHAIEE